MTGSDRLAIERVIVSTAIDSGDCLRAALDVLSPAPFKSHEAYVLGPCFYWTACQLERGSFDGALNRERLLTGMVAARWPKGWSDEERQGYIEFALAWTPLTHDPAAVRHLCAALRDEDDAMARLVAVRQSFEVSLTIRRVLHSHSSGPVRPLSRLRSGPPAPAAPRAKAGAPQRVTLGSFRR